MRGGPARRRRYCRTPPVRVECGQLTQPLLQRRAAITRLKSTLELVFPEFERVFPMIHKPTPLALLEAFPGPEALLAAPKRQVLAVITGLARHPTQPMLIVWDCSLSRADSARRHERKCGRL